MKRSLIFAVLLSVLACFSSCKKDDDESGLAANRNDEMNTTSSEVVSHLVRPPYLKEGDTVAVCSISNAVTHSEIEQGIGYLKSWGLTVLEADNLYAEPYDGRYSGTIEERVFSLQRMIDDNAVRAIFFARGGYGASQLLGRVDLSRLVSSPKWLIGYSDFTAIHIAVNNLGVSSVHGPMMRDIIKDSVSRQLLHDVLFGVGDMSITIATDTNCKQGVADGRLVGGNLSLIYSECGTPFDLNTTGAILFFEDTGESNYAIDRMLLALQLSGKLAQIKGVVVGEFFNCTQSRDISLSAIVQKYFGSLGIPIMYGVPSGHDTQNYALVLGGMAHLEVGPSEATISFR